jgi:co-chaperonin GroES (HSP10)
MKIRPVNNQIMIKIQEEERTGSLFIPSMVTQRINYGIVVAIPDDLDERIYPTKIKVGDRVFFKYFDGQMITVTNDDNQDEEFLLILRSEIQAVEET